MGKTALKQEGVTFYNYVCPNEISGVNAFLNAFIDDFKPSKLKPNGAYFGNINWIGHDTYQYIANNVNGATVFTIFTRAKIYSGFTYDDTTRGVFEFAGTNRPLS